MLIFVFLFLYWSNSSFFCFVTPTCFSLFSFCWSKYSVFQLFPPIQLASSFCPLEQIFYFSAFPPIQLASLFFPLEQIFCFSAFSPNTACFFLLPVGANILFFSFSPNPACFFLLPVGANILFFNFLPQSSLLLLFCHWSKCTVFYLFAPSQLHPPVLPLEQPLFIYILYSKPACFSCFAIGATTLHIHTLLQASLLLLFCHWSNHTSYTYFAPIQSQSCLNPASTKPQINPRLHSDHPRSGLTSASSVYRWIHTSQVQIVQIQLPHR